MKTLSQQQSENSSQNQTISEEAIYLQNLH